MIWQTGIHKVFVFWHTPHCISDFTYLIMYLVSSNNVILDANSLRQCNCYVCGCSHSNASSSLQRRLSRQQMDHRLTTKHHKTQLNKFLIEIHEPGQHPGALHYWHERRATYDLSCWHCPRPTCWAGFSGIHPTVFSVCGLLTQGCRNRITKSLEMRARLKLNAKVFTWMDYTNNVDCRNKA